MRSRNNYQPVPQNPRDLPTTGFSSTAFQFEDHSFTWEQVIRILRKNVAFALAVVFSLMVCVGLFVLFEKDTFKPTARLEISPPGSEINTLHEIAAPLETDNQDYLETQVQILQSDALLVSVIRELHLDKIPEFVSDDDLKDSPSPDKRVLLRPTGELAVLREQLDLANLSFAESIALERFRKRLSVRSVRNTRLVEISFKSHDSRLAQLITNILVANFIDQNYKHRYNTTMQASEWLSSQLNDLRRKVEESSQSVADYQKRHELVEVDDHDLPMSQLMNEVNRQLSDAQANRIENEAFVRMIDEGHGDAIPALRDDKLYQDLMGRYADLRAQLAQARTVYGDANLNVKKLQDQLAEVSVQIDAERKRVLARARSTYAASKQRELLMLHERNSLQTKMAHMSSQLADFHMLKTAANANVELYNTLQGRLQEAGIYAGLRSSNIRVVDLAPNLRKPTSPNRIVILVIGALASCFCAIVISFLRESFRNTVRTPDDIKSWIGLPSLALLPAISESNGVLPQPGTLKRLSALWPVSRNKNEKTQIEIMRAPTAEAEAIRDLRTALLHVKEEAAPRVVLISSSMQGEGKTTVAVNFAVALAQLARTCLLECDLREPSVAKAFKIEPQKGLSDFLNGGASLREVLIDAPGVDNLAIIPSGTISESPADVLSSPNLLNLLETLRQHYSFIVIDSPPVIRFSDARFLSVLADEVVLVGRYGLTTRRAMKRTAELLREMNASVAGVVLNGIDLSSPDYNYYSYGYAKTNTKRVDDPRDTGSNYMPPSRNNGKPGSMSAHA